MTTRKRLTRRDLIKTGALAALAPGRSLLARDIMQTRPIPGTDESLPVIGLGTYDVFDVAATREQIDIRRAITAALHEAGGTVIDTSPMYNRSEAVIGEVLEGMDDRAAFFLATKVWTDGREAGERQMKTSAELMGADSIDLMQVHNRRDIESHWPTIRAMQQSGFIRYNGVTDYRASALDAMMSIMRRYKPQFIQINYSLGERDAERELLPMAKDLGMAVLINRPFVAGRLFRAVGDRPLPGWATDFADTWAQFFLKFIVSHPAVTCVIPATSKLRHMLDNAKAGTGAMPDAKTRQRMAEFVDGL